MITKKMAKLKGQRRRGANRKTEQNRIGGNRKSEKENEIFENRGRRRRNKDE